MAEAYHLALIGETRAAIMADGRLIAMRLERDGDGPAAGDRVMARLSSRAGGRGFAEAEGYQLLLEPWPVGACEGQTLLLEVRRAAWLEPGRERLAKARAAPAGARATRLPLAARVAAEGHEHRAGWPADVAAQWAEAFEAAELGRLAFPGGTLAFTPTPAFTAVDVDGPAPDADAAAALLGRAVRLWGIGGSVVIDLPPADRAARQAAGAALDEALAGVAFERTAANGFGLLQLVLPRAGPCILERARLDRAGTAAVALLDAACREPRAGRLRLVATPPVIGWIERRPHLCAALARRTGRGVDVVAEPMAGEGHVDIAR